MQETLLSDDYNSVPQAFEGNKYAMMMGSDATATGSDRKNTGY